MLNGLKVYFRFEELRTDWKNEIQGGLTTFLTMAYILFLQPAVLSIAGMPAASVFLATCLSAAFATLLMGFLARYPIALAPGMGENFFFVFSVALAEVGGQTVGWEAALAVVFVSGVIFLLLTLLHVREMILEAVPPGLRNAIAVGIGLFIAEIGLMHGGIIAVNPTSMLPGLGDLSSPPVILALVGLAFTAILLARNVRGAVLFGILATALMGMLFGVVAFKGVLGWPEMDFTVFFAMDFSRIFTHFEFLTLIFIFLFMDMFDTLGTLVGVSEQAGFMDKEGHLPRADRALMSDAIGTVAGACMGTSTVTSYIESSSGVAAGARTGAANLVTALLFLLALFFYPLISMVGAGWMIPGSDPTAFLYPVTAPALIVVGSLMVRNVRRIDWEDVGESLPAFLTILGIPLTYSISDGLAFGFISYPLIKLFDGKGRQVSPLIYGLGFLFLARYLFL